MNIQVNIIRANIKPKIGTQGIISLFHIIPERLDMVEGEPVFTSPEISPLIT